MPVNAIIHKRKIPPLCSPDLIWLNNYLHVNVFLLTREAGVRWLQEVRNKSLQIDDNGICACVCHLCKSNSAGICSDLYVY